jgi:hypothetical protein
MTTMSAAQLVIMAVIIVALMAVWLSLVFLANRAPGRQRQAPAGTLPGQVGGAPREGTALVPPPRRPGDEGAIEQVPYPAIEDEPDRADRVPASGL